MTFIAQSRRNADSNWRHVASGYATAKETARARTLNDEMQRAGFRFSELHAHREDLVAGHVLTAEDGTQFRIIESETPAPTANTTPDFKTRAVLGRKGLTILLEASNAAGDGPAVLKSRQARRLAMQLLQLAEEVESFEADEAASASWER